MTAAGRNPDAPPRFVANSMRVPGAHAGEWAHCAKGSRRTELEVTVEVRLKPFVPTIFNCPLDTSGVGINTNPAVIMIGSARSGTVAAATITVAAQQI